MSKRNPSDILESLSSSFPDAVFIKLLKKHFYPALDSLPNAQRYNITSILATIEHDHQKEADRIRHITLIDYEATKKSLQAQLKTLNKDVRDNWHNGYEWQGELMGGLAGSIIDWLPKLWTVGVEDGAERPLVHKSLKLCHKVLGGLHSCPCIWEFSNLDCGDITIVNKSEEEVYSDSNTIYSAVAWLWRELLVSALRDREADLVKRMVEDIEELGFLNDVEQQLRQSNETMTPDGRTALLFLISIGVKKCERPPLD
ncbi:hypothetical protein K439DRAFT_1638854 [Ramaria rubella]|nr:hypothetical protein K439DRAFT_1638854 [Ramaria rubella]